MLRFYRFFTSFILKQVCLASRYGKMYLLMVMCSEPKP